MKKINLISASRGRPERMLTVLLNWIDNASDKNRISIIISIDSDDEHLNNYQSILNNIYLLYGIKTKLLINNNKNTVEAINRCKSEIDSDLIFLISDDTDCFPKWDNEVEKIIKDWDAPFVIKTDDGINTELITMPIFSRSYLNAKDYIYCPEYEHMFCDTELTCVTYIENAIIFANELKFKHLHYSQGYHEKDMTDEKNQSTFYTGMEIFKKRLKNNFNISLSDTKGEIPKEIVEWIDNN
jgi:hypothetical protein